ncbi:MAG: glycosyltransferase family 39 protein, partial [Gemmatimonadaceae bacterium]
AYARYGVLPFFLLLALVVWAWARRTLGELGGAAAVALVVCNPNVVAHAGLATTDVACAATITLSLFAALWWIDRPSTGRSILFGIALGLAVGSRLSAIAFIAVAVVACYAVRGFVGRTWRLSPSSDTRASVVSMAAVTMTSALCLWALYRFAVGPMHGSPIVVPAPAFVDGVKTFLLHGSTGHPTFLLGTPSNRGWWYYFPVALAVKTPLPLMILAIVGAVVAVRNARVGRDWIGLVPLVSALAMLAVSMMVRVDLGVRLVLPLYPLFAILGAQGALELWRSRHASIARPTLAVLTAATLWIPVRSYPDWLAYFNPLAGRHPEHVLVDSNLDWGQDLYRLRNTIVAAGITDSVYVAYFGTADLAAAGVPHARLLGLHEHRRGWIAASETFLAGEWVGTAYQWLYLFTPVARIGPSMILWHIPEPPPATKDSSQR